MNVKEKLSILVIVIATFSALGCGKIYFAPPAPDPSLSVVTHFTDPRDGKTYKIVNIGTQIWMAENLSYTGENSEIGLCYNKEPENCEKYGALYTWDEAMKVCPAGWHLPIGGEWDKLERFVDQVGKYYGAGEKLKAKSGWTEYDCKEPEKCAKDEFHFSALPGGFGLYWDGYFFYSAGSSGYWWSWKYNEKTLRERNRNAYYMFMKYDNRNVLSSDDNNNFLFSVRCVKD